MSPEYLAIIVGGSLSGGFVSGLAGFGTGLVALGIWLHALPPAEAACLVTICSVVSQAQTIPRVWHAIRPRRVLPFVIPGLLGVPLGTHLLGAIDPDVFRVCMGVVLIGFSSFLLISAGRLRLAWGGRQADAAIGFAGGVLGGLAGLSGPLPIIWASLRGWGRDERRGLFQSFNLAILAAALLAFALGGQVTPRVGWAAAMALPGTLIGSWLGARVYTKLSNVHFTRIILGLLAFSGATLVWSGL